MGASIKIRGHIFKPNTGRFTKAMKSRATRIWNESISEYIKAVASIVSLHQETSMSYASLFPTARKVKALGKLPPISPRVDAKKTYIDMSGTPHPGQYKTQWRGLAAGAGDKCSYISTGGPSGLRFYFRFEIQVYQYLMNELGEWKIPAFESLEAGRNAMAEYLDTYGKEMFPTFGEFMDKELIGV